MSNAISPATYPLSTYCSAWIEKIEASIPVKKDAFQKWADEAMCFFDGAMESVMWNDDVAAGPGGFLSRSATGWKPTFRMTYNRMFEAVALFAPSMYFRNPNVLASPLSKPQIDPTFLGLDINNPYHAQAAQQIMQSQQMDSGYMQQIASIYDYYLNWLQVAGAKKQQTRMAIVECLIKGASYLWTDLSYTGSGLKFIASEWVSCDDVFKDPDATLASDVTWVARKCVHPINVVEEKFGLPPGTLKGHIQSYNQAAIEAAKKNGKKLTDVPIGSNGKTHDLLEYYYVYSKNGFGQNLNTKANTKLKSDLIDVSPWGKHCQIVVARGVPFPLNLPNEILQFGPDSEEVLGAVSWPWPAWQDEPTGNGWPFVEYSLYSKPKSTWPVSIFKSVAGEMKFINWVLSFMADRVAAGCQTIVAISKAASAELKNQLFGANAPFTVVELADVLGKRIDEVISFLNSPDLGAEIWNVVAAIDDKIDKRLGLTPLIYGSTPAQMRSAEEARVKDQMVNIRPDDMANSVEDCLSMTVLKEAQCANFLLSGEDVKPVLGEYAAAVWEQFRESYDPDSIVHGFAFRIEAGSSRKPNKSERQTKLADVGSVIMPVVQGFATMGITGPYNAYVSEVCKAHELDPTPFLVPEFQPPEAGGGGGAEQEQAAVEMQMDQEKHAQEMQQSDEKHKQELQQSKEKSKADISIAKTKARASKSNSSSR